MNAPTNAGAPSVDDEATGNAADEFVVEIMHVDGRHEMYGRIGGSILAHTQEAIARGGDGCCIKVRKLDLEVQR